MYGALPGFDSIGAFSGNYKTPYGSSSSAATAPKGMDPFTAILGIGSLGASIFGGIGQQQAAAQSMQAQFDAQKAGTEAGARIAREQTYAQLGENLAARMAAERAGETAFGLQKRAKQFELGPGFEQGLANAWQSAQRGKLSELTPAAKELSQRENRNKLREALAERQGAMTGMFGRIAPQDVTTLFV